MEQQHEKLVNTKAKLQETITRLERHAAILREIAADPAYFNELRATFRAVRQELMQE